MRQPHRPAPRCRSTSTRRRVLRHFGLGALGALGAAAPLLAACTSDERRGGHAQSSPARSTPPSPGASGPAPTRGPTYTVEMTDQLRFEPDALTIPKGATVTWKNVGTTVHTATGDPARAVDMAHADLPAGAIPWDSGFLTGGQSWSHAFDVPGRYTYFCIPHETQGMIGHLTVDPGSPS